jgi:hypothetical protein
LNAHGRAGIGQFIGSALSAIAVFVALKVFHGGLTAAAVAVTAPLLVVNLVYLPVLLCRRLNYGLGKFYREIAFRPAAHVLPFAVCVVAGRLLFNAHPLPALGVCAVGCAVLAVFYWRSVLPPSLKTGLQRRFDKLSRRSGIPGTEAVAK